MEPHYKDDWLSIYEGDCRKVLAALPAESVHAVITSPPYWGLRDYGTPPLAWGGDPECEHEWGSLIPPRPGRGNKPGDFSTSSLTNPERQDSVPRLTSSGQYCQRCGGWLGQLGQEPTPTLFVEHLVEVFREVWRVLRPDGLLFLNLGDSYANDGKWGGSSGGKHAAALHGKTGIGRGKVSTGLKPKDLVGIPWRTAFALQDDGWFLRNDIIWATPNPMPESVSDRFTSSHEHVFMLAKSVKYFFDQDAVREPHTDVTLNRIKYGLNQNHPGDIGIAIPPVRTTSVEMDDLDALNAIVTTGIMGDRFANPAGRNRRDVWNIPTVPYKGAHYAVFPPKLVEPMLMAATSERGVCAECKTPLRREVERLKEPRGDSFGTKNIGEFDHGQAGSPYMETVAIVTTSWIYECGHVDAAVVPATVLDPFGGSGTVGVVAQDHGRRAILVDLNPEYLAQQLVRNAQVPVTTPSDVIQTHVPDGVIQAVLEECSVCNEMVDQMVVHNRKHTREAQSKAAVATIEKRMEAARSLR